MGQQLVVSDTPLQGVKSIISTSYVDERGAFSRWFCMQTLASVLPTGNQIRQINHSVNLRAGTVRGMHFQTPAVAEKDVPGEYSSLVGEYKLVRCIRGKVHDVVLDLRRHSDTFGHHFALELSEENQCMLLIPPGCAHGFQALADNSQLLYLHTQDYQPALEAGVKVDDPQFNIQWPLPIQHLSERDQSFALFSESPQGISL
ncbi:MAG TPA: dTDP-4-dehydrorhamnose 3,5-epimerase family protein [Cellvibrio sp.]